MFTNFDDLRDFAVEFVNCLYKEKLIQPESRLEIENRLIQQTIDKIKQDDCLIPGGGNSHCITDINEDYMIAFIDSDNIPLGIFTIFIDTFEEDDKDIERLYVSVNHTVVYLD